MLGAGVRCTLSYIFMSAMVKVAVCDGEDSQESSNLRGSVSLDFKKLVNTESKDEMASCLCHHRCTDPRLGDPTQDSCKFMACCGCDFCEL